MALNQQWDIELLKGIHILFYNISIDPLSQLNYKFKGFAITLLYLQIYTVLLSRPNKYHIIGNYICENMFCIKLLINMKTSKQIPTINQCISYFNMYIGTRPI
jgi:hypothetical protein